MATKKKIATSAAAVATAAVVLLGGTFAWQSISQTALNEASEVVNPGGRLHNDMWYVSAEENNNDIYVENFGDEDIFARVRLSEYMEVVLNQGTAGEKVVTITSTLKTLKDGAVVDTENNPTGKDIYDYVYDVHYFGEDNATDEYWTWATGGETVFMPTFNVNKDSLAADLNGLYVDRVGGISNRETAQYTDYTEWTEGALKTANAIYDIDSNMVDELEDIDISDLIDPAVTTAEDYASENVALVSEEHTAKSTANATLMSMSDWLTMIEDAGGYDSEYHGDYWVYDDSADGNGWVYYAKPIPAGEATGLLLDGITLNQVMDDTWYYAIEAKGQFITKDDLGQSDGTGFYADGETVSDDALILLEKIGVDISGDAGGETLYSTIELWHDGNSDTMTGGEFLLFGAEVYDENGDVIASTDEVNFTVEEETSSDVATMALFEATTMDGNALLVADDVVGRGVSQILVSASYTDENENEYSGEYTLDVAAGESPLSIGLTLDDREISYSYPSVYQMFMAAPAEHTYKFSAKVDDVAANNVTWSVDSRVDEISVKEEGGICALVTNTEWAAWGEETVAAGITVAQINTTTGAFTILLKEAFPHSMQFDITADDAETSYSNTITLFIGREDVRFDLVNADVENSNSVDARQATYTKGEDSTINLGFNLLIKDEEATIETGKLQNWTLYDGESPYDGTPIDENLYTVIVNENEKTATLTIPASSGITSDNLCIAVEYKHNVIAPRTLEGISKSHVTITEKNVSVADDEVTEFVILDYETGEESATYTPGTYQKIKLEACPTTANDNYVNSGSVIWGLVNDTGTSASYENVKLVDNGFTAEVWILKATAKEIKVTAQYIKDDTSGITKDDTFVISAVEGADTTAPTVNSVEGNGPHYTYTITGVSDTDFPMTMKVYYASDESGVYADNATQLYTVTYTLSDEGTVAQTGDGTMGSSAWVTYTDDTVTSYLNTITGEGGYWGVTVTDAAGNVGRLETPIQVESVEGCFVAGTQVQTVNGLVNIEDIRLGDEVYSYDLTTGKKVVSTVAWVQGTRYIDATYTIYAGGEKAVATYEHPFYVVGKEWVAAEDLVVGDKLMDMNGNEVTITKIVYTPLDEPVQVYNFTVDGTHNYLITETGILVHNILSKG